MKNLKPARLAAEKAVDLAVRAGARYNSLHTSAWQLAPRQGEAISPECKAAFAVLRAATPKLLAVREAATAAAAAANWSWPQERVAPWAATGQADFAPVPAPVGKAAPVAASSAPTVRKARKGVPGPVALPVEPVAPSARIAAASKYNAVREEAVRLGKPADWQPLQAAHHEMLRTDPQVTVRRRPARAAAAAGPAAVRLSKSAH